MREVLIGLAIAGFVAFIGFLLQAWLWMSTVKENHLTHIQAGVERTADEATKTNSQLAELAIREDERHKQQLQAFEELKAHIRVHGL